MSAPHTGLDALKFWLDAVRVTRDDGRQRRSSPAAAWLTDRVR
jgi:hypothetical protein